MIRIRLFGVFNKSGIGVHAYNISKALSRFANANFEIEEFDHFNEHDIYLAKASSEAEDKNLFFFPAAYASELNGQKFLWAVFESTRPQPGYEKWISVYDLILSPSSWAKDRMVDYGIPEDHIRVVPEGVDTTVFHPYGDEVRVPNRILMVGKYEERKSYEEAFLAFDELYRAGVSFEVAIKADWLGGGRSAQHPNFVSLCRAYSHLPVILYSGIVSDNEMASLYRSAGIFLFPSKCEGWGLPLLEAVASGCQVVATDFGGHSEYIRVENWRAANSL